MRTLVARLAMLLLASVGCPQVVAATVPVTVTVNRVMNISAGDAWSRPPDFYARIWIDGAMLRTPMVPDSNGFSSPAGWTFTRQVSRAARGSSVSIRIELRDWDAPFDDPLVDIDPSSSACSNVPDGCVGPSGMDDYGIDVTLDLSFGSWSPVDVRGDSSMPGSAPAGVGQMACTTGAGHNVANICFTITVGASTPEVLTVSKTSDSNRSLCAPGDCSLREAVAVAESGDIIELPASPAPYTLGEHGDLHLAIRPTQANTPRTVSIRGVPRNGVTAVIRQTWAPYRVFDVHERAKLVLSHVTLTGGGAYQGSTAHSGHQHGGGIHNHGEIELLHVTITGNRATFSQAEGGGGGIYNADKASARLTNVTIAHNVSWPDGNGIPLGGGIAGPGTYTLRNTLLVNNTTEWTDGTAGGPANCGQSKPLNIIDLGGNLQYPVNDCGFWRTRPSKFSAPITYWWPYFATASVDPLLPLDARGVFVPLPSGPAIDIGSSGCGPTDQLGRATPIDGNGDGVAVCDAGAIESP